MTVPWQVPLAEEPLDSSGQGLRARYFILCRFTNFRTLTVIFASTMSCERSLSLTWQIKDRTTADVNEQAYFQILTRSRL